MRAAYMRSLGFYDKQQHGTVRAAALPTTTSTSYLGLGAVDECS